VATYQFSALSDGQAISFNPTTDVLNFDQSSIAAADIRVTASGTSTRIDVITGPQAGKDITLLNTTPFQLATSNVTFVDGSRLLFGDNSTAIGDDNGNTLTGGTGRDLIFAFGGSDTINIGTASYGGDHIDGGTGFDTLNFNGYVTAALTIDFAAGTITSSGGSATFANIERVLGGAGNDSIAGAAGSQNITSVGGNDTLWGAGGVDTLWSGIGADVFLFREVGSANADNLGDFTSGTDKITLDAAVMTALGASGNFAAGDARFWAAAGATGGHDADDRVVYNTTTRQVFYDADGNGSGAAQLVATLQSGATLVATDIVVQGGPAFVHIIGTEGDDSLTGTNGNDLIEGLGGNDTLGGMAGDDSLLGGDGDDLLVGHAGRDRVEGGAGADTLAHATWDNDTLDGGAGIDTLRLQLAASAVTVDLAAGTMLGGDSAGAATVNLLNIELVDAGFLDRSVHMIGSAGNDLLRGGTAADRLFGGDGNDTVYGSSFATNADGDELYGGAGSDLVSAFGGNGLLDGGTGHDFLSGGEGIDRFVFSAAPGESNYDSVFDFAPGTDKIVLDGNAFPEIGPSGSFSSGDDRFAPYINIGPAGTIPSGFDPEDRLLYDIDTGDLWYDPDGSGNGVAQRIARVEDAPRLTATDFEVVNGIENQAINGTAANDSLVGGEGNDTINGFGGNDTIDGQAGNDQLDGGTGNDSIRGDEGADSIVGGDGNDTLSAGANGSHGDGFSDTLDGGLGDDVYIVSDDPDTILADPGGLDTVILASNGEFTLTAGLENLELQGMFGGTGIGNELDNLITGGGEGSSAYGMGGNDRLFVSGMQFAYANGGEGNDTLSATAFHGGTMEGETGADSFLFGAPVEGEVTDFASGVDKLRLDASNMTALGASGNFLAGDARFYAAPGATAGHDADDRVVYNTSTRQLFYDPDGSGTQAAELIVTLQAGANVVATDIAVDNGTDSVMNGTAGNDSMTGTAGNDSMNGLAGNDTLRGLGGDDTLDGGSGVDSLDGGLGNDTYVVTAGDVIVADPGGIDTVVTPVSWNISNASIENITMTGTSNVSVEGNNLANRIIGNDAPNYINARAGADTLIGNGGNDTFNMSMGGTTSFGEDWIEGGAGIDTVEFATNARSGLNADLAGGRVIGGETGGTGRIFILDIERFIAGDFNDVVTGNDVANYIDARAGDDAVNGGAGNDTLVGGTGNDRLAGGTGVDSMTGGLGTDSFVFAESGTANADRITDFVSGSNEIALDDFHFTSIGAAGDFAAGDGRFWAAAGATSGHDANDRVIYNTSTGSLYYDADGSGAGAAQLIATFTGNPAVAATDITVI
jgi:Ca2+-binding RTX toxin-like protein